MTTYRLWPAANGGPLVAYTSTPFIAATQFAVSGGGRWMPGLWWWVPTGGDTGPVKTAVWSLVTGAGGGAGVLVPGSVATSGTLSATPTGGESGGHWNFIVFSTPIQLAPGWDKNATANGSTYLACVGINGAAGDTAVPAHGFPDTGSYWGSGAGASGITSGGVLIGYSAAGHANGAPYGMQQGLFSTAGADPSLHMPTRVSGTDNFWVDPQIDDTAPANYSGTYRLWPNKYDANPVTTGDLNVNYTVATEVALSAQCALNNAWFFSPAAATTLPTQCDVWNIGTGLSVASITSPSWKTHSGAAFTAGTTPDGGSTGTWIKAAFAANTVLPPGSYRVSAFNSAGTTDTNWSPKDSGTDYWGQTLTGAGSGGITNGPLSAPGYASASPGFLYNASSSGATPPYSNGTVAHAQPPFGQLPGGTVDFPQLYAPVGAGSNQSQQYWVDLEVTLSPGPAGVAATLALAAPAGSVAASSSVAGPAALLALAAPAGSLAASSAVTGTTASLALGALPGAAAAGTVVGAVPAGMAFAAAAGSVSASSSAAGVPAALALTAWPGAPSGTPVSAVLALTAADTGTGTLTATTIRTGGPG